MKMTTSRSMALAVFLGGWLAGQFLAAPRCLTAQGPEMAAPELTGKIDGLVLEHQKYSFTVRGLDRDCRVSLPNGTPILMKLTWPEIDFDKKELSVRLLVTSPDGDANNNAKLFYPIADPLYITAEFGSQASLDAALRNAVVETGKFTLSPEPPVPVPFALQGKLLPGSRAGEYRVDNGANLVPVRLDPRKGLLLGARVTDLRPNETEVFAEGSFENGILVARSIRFQHIGDPFAGFDPSLPNALVIGDQISIGYDPALRQALAGKMNIHHPPCNCGGAENWREIHRWLANPDGDQRRWDVIAFNFGLQDVTSSEFAWKSNLRNAIRTLAKTGARLVWITTTPIPRGFEKPYAGNTPQGLVQGRTELQNQWARQVLDEFPAVRVCDLEKVVTTNPNGLFDEWWEGKSPTFNGNQYRPLAHEVARALMESTDRTSRR